MSSEKKIIPNTVAVKEKSKLEMAVTGSELETFKEYQYVGKSVVRTDGVPKITGKAKYVGDLKVPDMLHGKILWSSYAHANIKSIDTSKAKELPGVQAVITWEDVERVPYCPAGHPYPDDSPLDTYVLDNKVRFMGDPVAAVAAESVEIAEAALKLIKVEYEELPPILSIEAALQENSPEIHKGSGNLAGQNSFLFGDVEKGFEEAALVVEDELITPIVYHCPMENHVSLTYFDDDMRLVIHSATQVPFHLRRICAKALNLPIGKIRVIKTYVGGGFGGKEDVAQEPINAVLTQKTGKPVLMEFTREEDVSATLTRHSMKIKVKSGLDSKGKFIARKMEVLSNTGAYAAHGHNVVYSMSARFVELYPTPNIAFEGKSVYTNMPIASAMRSYGIAQYNFAMEAHMDNIAKKMNIDPIELRRKNMCKLGDRDQLAVGEIQSCGLEECIAIGEKLSDWKNKRNTDTPSDEIIKRGLGIAIFSYPSGTVPHNEEMDGARITLNEDGSATLFIATAEIGQGNDTAMAQIAAEEMGIPIGNIKVIAVDTDLCPIGFGAYASRQLYVGGMAVKKVAVKCREALLGVASRMLEVPAVELYIRENIVYKRQTDEAMLTIEEVAMKAFYDKENPTPISFEEYHVETQCALAFGAVVADVEVDTGTGRVEVKKIWATHDSGKIVNPRLAEGQVYGGVSMGLGFGLMEQLLVDKKTGRTLNDNLLNYKIATTLDMPPVVVNFVETIDPTSAYGNKALGEPPVVSVAPAIRNAVLNAVGVEYSEIPLTPERVLMKLKEVEC
jgi:xanthine dehydrogenase molybdenum-binding subunit